MQDIQLILFKQRNCNINITYHDNEENEIDEETESSDVSDFTNKIMTRFQKKLLEDTDFIPEKSKKEKKKKKKKNHLNMMQMNMNIMTK